MTGRLLIALLAIAALALAGRVAYVMIETRHQELDLSAAGQRSDVRRSFDELYHVGTAERLADGNGFRRPPFFGPPQVEAADPPPLTGLVLWPVAWLFDGSELAMRLTMAILGTAVVVLVGLTGASWPARSPAWLPQASLPSTAAVASVAGACPWSGWWGRSWSACSSSAPSTGIPRSRIAGEASLVVLAAVGIVDHLPLLQRRHGHS